eukprot:IDg510t1
MWHHLEWLACDYTSRNPDTARVAPLALRLADQSWVCIPGALCEGRTDGDSRESLNPGIRSWRSYFPGFPAQQETLEAGWYRRLEISNENREPMHTTDIVINRLGVEDPYYKVYEPPFAQGTESEFKRYYEGLEGPREVAADLPMAIEDAAARTSAVLGAAEGMELEVLASTGGRQEPERNLGGSADSSFDLVGGF